MFQTTNIRNKELYKELMSSKNPQDFRDIVFKKKHPNIYDDIVSFQYPDFCKTFGQKLYHYIHNDFEFMLGVCPVCGKRCTFANFKHGYQKTCSTLCNNRYEVKKEKIRETNNQKTEEEKQKTIEKSKKTNEEKYGGVGFASKELKEKYKKTMLETYGVEHNSKMEDVIEKRKETSLKNFGVDNPMKSDIVKEKSKETNRKKYGVDYVLQSKEIRDKIAKTNMERYGSKAPIGNKEIQEKAKNTNLLKYGNQIYQRSNDYKEKTKRTSLEKYGVKYFTQSNVVKGKIRNAYEKRRFAECDDILELHDTWHLCKCTEPTCEKCVEKTFKISKQLYYIRHKNGDVICTKLNNPRNKHTSMNEKLVYDLVCELYKGEVQRNNRKELNKKEIDIYLPELKKGIEFNGDYWHNNPNTMFDAERMDVWEKDEQKEFLANQNGIEILHIWENELSDIEYVKYKIARFVKSTTPKTSAYYKLKTFLDGLQAQYVERVFGEFEYNNVVVKYVNAFYHNNSTTKSSFFSNSEKRVIYAYDYEVNDGRKFGVLQSQIEHSLGLTKTKIYARNCELREITNKEAKPFLEENSLYGYRGATITLGLFYKGELSMVYSFGHNYYGRKGALEVIRVCTLKNVVVVGGSSKCLSYFLKKYAPSYRGNKLVFYVDKIHQDGKSLNGFKYVHHYDGVMNYWLKENFGGSLYGEVGTAFSRNPSKNKEIAKLEKDGYLVSVPTVGVDVYEMVL